jgi:prepilin-type N-terminal cleavage/methylation domain-containing protein
MKTNRNNGQRSAFTLIEMVGVLAVIAILAALLVPKIFAAINDSRFSNTVASINSCKTATMDYFGKKGTFGANSTAFDTELVKENCLERPLAVRLAETSASAEVVALTACANLAAVTALAGAGGNYVLDGLTPLKGGQVVQIKLSGVVVEDARELSRRIDGETSAVPSLTTAEGAITTDTLGRVTYETAAAAGALVDVFIYVAHK